MTITETLRQPRSANCLLSDETPCGPTAVAALALCEEGSCPEPCVWCAVPHLAARKPIAPRPERPRTPEYSIFLERGVRFAFFGGGKIDCPGADSKTDLTYDVMVMT